MRLATLFTAFLLIALPARADPLQDAADEIENCVATAWPRDVMALCPGIVSDPCQETESGQSAEGMNQCLAAEADAWDVVMDRLLPKLMTRSREVDGTDDAASDTTSFPLDSAVETLRAAQRAWVVFRDAECRHNYASWGGSDFRTIAHSACRLELTARRVVAFHARLETGK